MRTMDEESRQQLRQMLEQQREALLAELADDEYVPGHNLGLGNHMADDGTEAFEQATHVSLQRHHQVLLERIDEALHRMETGTYGLCERCGRQIEIGRLKALPYATLCIECQTEIER